MTHISTSFCAPIASAMAPHLPRYGTLVGMYKCIEELDVHMSILVLYMFCVQHFDGTSHGTYLYMLPVR